MNKFQNLIDLSRALFTTNHSLRTFHTSFIIYKSKIISIATNTSKTTPTNLLNPKNNQNGEDISRVRGTCSELNCINHFINKSSIPFKKCVLINIRLDRNNNIRNSKPCVSCFSLLQHYNFKAVFFSNDMGQFEKYY